MISLSGGMKRRVLIAKALAHEPEILFLDEPSRIEPRYDDGIHVDLFYRHCLDIPYRLPPEKLTSFPLES